MARKKYEIRERYICSDGSVYHINAHSEREKKRKIAERERQIREKEPVINGSGVRIKDVADDWVDTYRTDASDEYKRNIKSRIRKHILPELGNMTFEEVTTERIQQFLHDLSCKSVSRGKKGKELKKGISDGYIKKIYMDLNFLFDRARKCGYIAQNPVVDASPERGVKQVDRRAATKDEVALLKKAAESDSRFVFFLVMLYCGLRNSEVGRLQGKNIITVKGKPFIDVPGTKTESAPRKVPIPEELMDKLPKCRPDEYIFKPLDGRLTNHKNLDSSAQTRLWKACKRKMNILAGCKMHRNQLVPPFPVADDLTPYCFRHSYATVLHLNKVPMDFRKYLLGHRSIQTTIDVYTHLGLMTADEIADNMAVDDLFKVYE